MNARRRLDNLRRLAGLREREVDRLSAEVADKQATRERYLGNLARLDQLCNDSGASGAQSGSDPSSLSPALSLNCAEFKQAVMQMADSHRVDLSLHESQMQLTQDLMVSAVRRRESLGQILDRQVDIVRRSQNALEQKNQDNLAAQVWLRGKK
jgi:flagellar export protein FliJ